MKIDAISNRDSSPWSVYENYKNTLQQAHGDGNRSLAAGGTQETAKTKKVNNTEGCQTCKERKYQDASDDPGVSFKNASRVAPEQAAAMVRSHESEHVGREQDKAEQEGREVVSQSVTYHNGICSECGRVYASGGTTETVTRGKKEQAPSDSSGFQAYA